MDTTANLNCKKDKHFERLRNGICQELLKANEHFNTLLQFIRTPKKITDIMDKYRTFFYYTLWAHRCQFCISVYNVTKYNEQTSNIPRLLCYIKYNKNLSKVYSSSDMGAIDDKLKSYEDLLDKIYMIRNQYFAHNQLNKRHLGFAWKHIYEESVPLLTDLQKIYDSLSLGYDRTSTIFKTIPSINIEELLTDLTEYKKIRRMDRKGHHNG